MPVFETFAERKHKGARSGKSDVYVYDELSIKARVQITQIISESMGEFYLYSRYDSYKETENNESWTAIFNIMRHSIGQDNLIENETNIKLQILNYIRSENDIDLALSAIELCCISIDITASSSQDEQGRGITMGAEDAISQINYRLRADGAGYQYESRQIIRIDSQFIHTEVVKLALALLSDHRFAGPEREFLEAHKHYRSGQHKDAVTWANKAFESTMKAVCDIKGWTYNKGARATDLLKVLRSQGLWPTYLDNSFDQLLATLASGLPQVRNESGAHGDGPKIRETPDYIAGYALHLAACQMVLIVQAAG